MTNPLVYCRIVRRARESHLKVPSNYKSILHCYTNIKKPSNDKIVFSWMYDGRNKNLNANAALNGKILFNSEWAARVVLFDSEETLNAFKSTVGHELTHKDNEIDVRRFSGPNKQFVGRVNEVRADFGAGQKMLNSQRNLVLEAINYKKALKNKDRCLKNDPHPTWEQRYNYIKNYNFNKELIHKIADDMNYHNEEIIEKVCNYYEDIFLVE